MRGISLGLVGIFAVVFPPQNHLGGRQVLTNERSYHGIWGRSADGVNPRRVVSVAVSDDLVGSTKGKREGSGGTLIGGYLFPKLINPVFEQIILQARAADLRKPIFHENDVPEHGYAGTECLDPTSDGCGPTTLREEENREDLNVSGRRVSFVGPLERRLDGGLVGFIPRQRHAGRIDADVDPSSGAGERGGPGNVRLVAGGFDCVPTRIQRTRSEPSGSESARRTSRREDYAPFPVPPLSAAMLVFFGLASAVRGWREGPEWLFLTGMCGLVAGGAGMLIITLLALTG